MKRNLRKEYEKHFLETIGNCEQTTNLVNSHLPENIPLSQRNELLSRINVIVESLKLPNKTNVRYELGQSNKLLEEVRKIVDDPKYKDQKLLDRFTYNLLQGEAGHLEIESEHKNFLRMHLVLKYANEKLRSFLLPHFRNSINQHLNKFKDEVNMKNKSYSVTEGFNHAGFKAGLVQVGLKKLWKQGKETQDEDAVLKIFLAGLTYTNNPDYQALKHLDLNSGLKFQILFYTFKAFRSSDKLDFPIGDQPITDEFMELLHALKDIRNCVLHSYFVDDSKFQDVTKQLITSLVRLQHFQPEPTREKLKLQQDLNQQRRSQLDTEILVIEAECLKKFKELYESLDSNNEDLKILLDSYNQIVAEQRKKIQERNQLITQQGTLERKFQQLQQQSGNYYEKFLDEFKIDDLMKILKNPDPQAEMISREDQGIKMLYPTRKRSLNRDYAAGNLPARDDELKSLLDILKHICDELKNEDTNKSDLMKRMLHLLPEYKMLFYDKYWKEQKKQKLSRHQ